MANHSPTASGDGNKIWERAWSTDELRQNASSWNLAADSGLLQHLQQFSHMLLSKTHSTEKALDSLMEDMNETAADINNVNNRFLCLANTQFVENRVYDDDDDDDEDKDTSKDDVLPDKKTKEETEAAMLKRVKEVLSMSVAVLDTMFEPIEVQASDSDGEVDEEIGSFTRLLEPHNPYINRPLPHLIGSNAFMKDDDIGLGESLSDEEESPHKVVAMDVEYSAEVYKRQRNSGSTSDSNLDVDSDFGLPNTIKKSKADPEKDSSTNYTADELGENNFNKGDNFAALLAAKLGGIAKESGSGIGNKSSYDSGDLFGGSDEEDDALFTGQSSLFSSRPKLFGNSKGTSNSLWDTNDDVFKTSPSSGPSVDKKVDFTVPRKNSENSPGTLFSSNHSNDDDSIFTAATCTSPKRQQALTVDPLQSGVKAAEPQLFQDEMESSISPSSAKPAQGELLFQRANVIGELKGKLPRRQLSSSSSSSGADTDVLSDKNRKDSGDIGDTSTGIAVTKESDGLFDPPFSTSKTISRTSDNISNQSDNISNKSGVQNHSVDALDGNCIQSNKRASNSLFAADDYDEDYDLFKTAPKKSEQSLKKDSSIFGTNSLNDHLFSHDKSSTEKTNSMPISSKQPTFFDDDLSKNSLFSANSTESRSEISKRSIYSTVPPPIKKEEKAKKFDSIFDDSDSGDEFLFSSASSAGSRRSQASADRLPNICSTEKKPFTKKGLFDDDDVLFASVPNEPEVDIFSGLSNAASTGLDSTQNNLPLNTEKLDTSLDAKAVMINHSNYSDDVFTPKSSNDPSAVFQIKNKTEDQSIFSDDYNDEDDLFNVKTVPLAVKKSTTPELDSVKHISTNSETETFRNTSPQKSKECEEKLNESDNLFSSKSEIPPEKHKAISKSPPVILPKPSSNNPKKPEPPKTLNIRNTTDPNVSFSDGEDDDKFEDIFESAVNVSKKKVDTIEKIFNYSNSDAEEKLSNSKGKPIVPNKTVSHSDLGMSSSSTTSSLKSDSDRSHHPARGNLNSRLSLNIDPRALLPGAKPPSKQSSPPVNSETSNQKAEERQVSLQSGVGFDQPIANNATLPSAQKDRAKLGVKRRPPSSKVRREAARASVILDDATISPSPVSSDFQQTAIHNNVLDNVLSPSTDEDDLFGVPQDLPPEYGAHSEASTDIFAGAPILSPVASIDENRIAPVQKTDKSNETSDEFPSSQPRASHVDNEKVFSEDTGLSISSTDLMKSGGLFKESPLLLTDTLKEKASSEKDIFSDYFPSESAAVESSQNRDSVKSRDEGSDQFLETKDTNKTSSKEVLFDSESLQNPVVSELSNETYVRSKSKSSNETRQSALLNKQDTVEAPFFKDSKKSSLPSNNLPNSSHLSIGAGNLFDNEDDDSDDLFKSVPKSNSKAIFSKDSAIPKLPSKSISSSSNADKIGKTLDPSPKLSLFDEENVDDKDDDLFSNKLKNALPKNKMKPAAKTSSLFEDDDDDDGLFGPPLSNTRTTATNAKVSSPMVKTIPKTSQPATQSANCKVLKSTVAFKDPLSALQDDD